MEMKINDYLFLQVESDLEEEAVIEYKARITDTQDDTFAIEIPINKQTGRLKKMHVGNFVYAYFVSEGGVKNFFNTIVLGFKEETIHQVVLQKPRPDMVTKVQRRNYLRVMAELEVAVKLPENQHSLIGVTEDLSGGGLSFMIDGKHVLQPRMNMSCWLVLPFRNNTVEHVKFECEVIRLKPLVTGKQLVMSSITTIHNVDRQKIMKYCFERQLELRK